MIEDQRVKNEINKQYKDVKSIGFLGRTQQGEFITVEPLNHYDDVSCTIPKVQLLPKETPYQGLQRCIKDKLTGVDVSTCYPVQLDVNTTKGKTVYFTGLSYVSEKLEPVSQYVHSIYVSDFSNTERNIKQSKNPKSSQRDLKILNVAKDMEIHPFLIIYRSLEVLHQHGFQRLRLLARSGQGAGFYRIYFIPKHIKTEKEFIGYFEHFENKNKLFGYSSASGHKLFSISGTFKSHQILFNANELAEELINVFSDMVYTGWGEDQVYADFYSSMLKSVQNGDYVETDIKQERAVILGTLKQVPLIIPN